MSKIAKSQFSKKSKLNPGYERAMAFFQSGIHSTQGAGIPNNVSQKPGQGPRRPSNMSQKPGQGPRLPNNDFVVTSNRFHRPRKPVVEPFKILHVPRNVVVAPQGPHLPSNFLMDPSQGIHLPNNVLASPVQGFHLPKNVLVQPRQDTFLPNNVLMEPCQETHLRTNVFEESFQETQLPNDILETIQESNVSVESIGGSNVSVESIEESTISINVSVESIEGSNFSSNFSMESSQESHFPNDFLVKPCEAPYFPGDIIVRSCEAFFKVLDMELQATHCNTCFKRSRRMLRCLSCMRVRYCSPKCQQRDLQNGHNLECSSQCFSYISQSWAKEDQVPLFRLYALMKANPGKVTEKQRTFNGQLRSFEDLMTNESVWKTDIRVQHLCADLARHLKKEDGQVTTDKLIKLYGTLKTNSLEISEGWRVVGRGIYIQGTVFDHSCRPTARWSTDDGKLEVRALVFIPRDQPPLISYVDLDKPKKERLQLLKEVYRFHCCCEGCSERSEALHLDYERLTILNKIMSWYLSNPQKIVGHWENFLGAHKDYIAMLKQLRHECDLKIAHHCTELADAIADTPVDGRLVQFFYQQAYSHICSTFGPGSIVHDEFFRQRPNLHPLSSDYPIPTYTELAKDQLL